MKSLLMEGSLSLTNVAAYVIHSIVLLYSTFENSLKKTVIKYCK